MSSSEAADAVAKLERLSDARAQRVLSLIEDLAELEAMENAEDLKGAREALGDAETPVPWNQVKSKLDAQFSSPQPTG